MSHADVPLAQSCNANEPLIPDNLTLPQFILDHHHYGSQTRLTQAALIEERTGRRIGVTELRDRTDALAHGLRCEFGISDNDVVLLSSPNHVDYPVVIWAIHRLGAIVTLSNPNFTEQELSSHIRLTKPSIIIAHLSSFQTVHICAARAEKPIRVLGMEHSFDGTPSVMDLIELNQGATIQDERYCHNAEKVAALCLSSGTTGTPKVIRLSHRSFIANILQMNAHNPTPAPGLQAQDTALGVLPFYHVAGLVVNLHYFLFAGLSVVVVDKYDFPAMLETIARYAITTLIIVPPQAISFCNHPAVKASSLQSVKCVIVGAAPVPKGVQHSLSKVFRGAHIGQAYGTTEATCTIAMLCTCASPLGSAGKVLPGIQFKVVKSDGSLANTGEPGELYVKGPSVALGYLDDSDSTQETFTDGGWVRTGDQVSITDNRDIFVHDRLKDFIKVRGFGVAPAELEDCLLQHPDVLDACVIGVPNDYSGEVPKAFVVLKPSALRNLDPKATEHSILQHVTYHKLPYKHLKGGIEFVSSIPKTASGKILRRIVRESQPKVQTKL